MSGTWLNLPWAFSPKASVLLRPSVTEATVAGRTLPGLSGAIGLGWTGGLIDGQPR